MYAFAENTKKRFKIAGSCYNQFSFSCFNKYRNIKGFVTPVTPVKVLKHCVE